MRRKHIITQCLAAKSRMAAARQVSHPAPILITSPFSAQINKTLFLTAFSPSGINPQLPHPPLLWGQSPLCIAPLLFSQTQLVLFLGAFIMQHVHHPMGMNKVSDSLNTWVHVLNAAAVHVRLRVFFNMLKGISEKKNLSISHASSLWVWQEVGSLFIKGSNKKHSGPMQQPQYSFWAKVIPASLSG